MEQAALAGVEGGGDDDTGAEIAALQAEADLPIEQLMAAYAAAASDSSCLEEEEEEDEAGGADRVAEGTGFLVGPSSGADEIGDHGDDDEYEIEEEVVDDEATLEEEERRAREEGDEGRKDGNGRAEVG